MHIGQFLSIKSAAVNYSSQVIALPILKQPKPFTNVLIRQHFLNSLVYA